MLDFLATLQIDNALRLVLSTFFFTSAFWGLVLLVVIIVKKGKSLDIRE